MGMGAPVPGGCCDVVRWLNHLLLVHMKGHTIFVEYEIGNCDLFPGRHRMRLYMGYSLNYQQINGCTIGH
jgi:hypothetical protein